MNKFKEFVGGDYTAIEHAVVAVIIQLIVFVIMYAIFGWLVSITAGTAAGMSVFIGREHAQAEELLCKTMSPRNKAVIAALKFWKWKYGSQMDMYCPIVSTILVFFIVVLICY